MANPSCKCDICGKILSNRDYLKLHIQRLHFPNNPVKCPYCDRVVKSYSLKGHVENFCRKSGKTPILVSCPKCQKLVKQTSLGRHLQSHEEKKHFCEICMRGYSCKLSYKYHVNRYHSGSPGHKCQICEKNFYTESSLKRHQETHRKSRKYTRTPCHLCGRVVSLEIYNRHISACSGRKDFHCYFCQKQFATFHILDGHMTGVHTKEKPFACNKCPYKTRLSHSLYLHQTRRHNGRKNLYPCYFCGQTFHQKRSVNNHFNMKHIKEKPYKCGYCPRRFPSSNALSFHMGRRGWNEDEHGLQVGKHPCKTTRQTCPHCGIEKFTKHLIRHIRIAHGPPRFTCYFCGNNGFASRYDLDQHLLRHHLKEKPFKCPHCPFFSTCYHDSLKKHVEIHRGPDRKKFSCYFCGKLCYRSNDYNTHLKSHLLEKGFQCYRCSKRFLSYYKLQMHRSQSCTAEIITSTRL